MPNQTRMPASRPGRLKRSRTPSKLFRTISGFEALEAMRTGSGVDIGEVMATEQFHPPGVFVHLATSHPPLLALHSLKSYSQRVPLAHATGQAHAKELTPSLQVPP